MADEEGTTLRAIIEEALRQSLDHRTKREDFVLRDAHFKGRGRGLTPEFATGGWDKIRGAIHGDPE